jgi:hypothetical protein
VARLKDLPALRKTWVFDTRAAAVAEDPAASAK